MVWNDQDKNKSEELELIKIQQYDYPWNAESFIKHLQVFGYTHRGQYVVFGCCQLVYVATEYSAGYSSVVIITQRSF